MADQISTTDFAILPCLKTCGSGMWKKIFQHLQDQEHLLPLDTAPSVQTASRHIDRLQTDGYVQSVIVSPEDVNRQYTIGFSLTAAGEDAVEAKRRDSLRTEVVMAANTLIEPYEAVTISG